MMEMLKNAAAAVHGVFQSDHKLKAQWQRIDCPPLPRSSHTLSVVSGRAYIFGGETNPGEPVDNDMHIVTLPTAPETAQADYRAIAARAQAPSNGVPEKRIGHSAAVIGDRIFIFGGRGNDMNPLEENGRVWIYNTRTDSWTYLDPMPGTPYPAARSYHSSVAIGKPEPKSRRLATEDVLDDTQIGKTAEGALTDEQSGGRGTFFVHAGCLKSERTSDFWAFDIMSRTWQEYPTPPGRPRSGSSIAISKQRIYVYGGFNGEEEEGGQIDVLELQLTTLTGIGSSSEVSVSPKRGWETLNFAEEDMLRPGNRSVAGMHTISAGRGREFLILFLGERDASNQGSQATFWDDVWAFQCPPQGMTAASFDHATRQALGKETGEGLWTRIDVADAEGREGEDVRQLMPGGRGWFASSSMGDLDVSGIVLWGGLVNSLSEGKDDGWILRLE